MPEHTPQPPAVTEGQLDDGIFYRHWPASGPARGVILLAHGLGEHSGRYEHFAAFFTRSGYAVVAPDHVGHGRSPGRRAHVQQFADYLQPLLTLRSRIDDWYTGLPCFLLGHSLGGLIASRLLLDAQSRFAGAALSGPALAVDEPPPAPLLLLNRLLAWLWPTLGMLKLDASQVSRDPQVVAAYEADPLVHHGKVSARLVRELFATMAVVNARAAEITLPLLVMHGEADVMTAPAGSRDFSARVGSSDVTLRLYPDLYHEIFNEPEQEQVFAELAAWMQARA
ncbi:alpha/beta hydrolase [Haliea sp.]|uniref:alpha/beta hydrolase n=1 Tax=Haliea sp. TaxID=1932666 RepID=UPI0025C4EA80|nr:alpha/beta hydrolase [Haliea sp.]